MTFFTGQAEKPRQGPKFYVTFFWVFMKARVSNFVACIMYHNTHWRFSLFIWGGFLELWFSYAQIFETRHRMTFPHGNRLMAFYKSIIQAKSLRKFRQMEEMFAVLLHYTQQELFRLWGGFSAKVTHCMLVHGKVNCRKYKNITVYLVYVCQ